MVSFEFRCSKTVSSSQITLKEKKLQLIKLAELILLTFDPPID